jgi:hypothetical protein
MIQDIFLKLSWPNWLFSITALVLAVAAYLFYFRTLPPLSGFRRVFNLTLRAIVLVILLFLILEPVLRLLYQQQEKPVVAILLDTSASMKIEDPYGERGDSLRYVAEHLERLQGIDSVDIHPFLFDVTNRPWNGDSLKFTADGSDISQAIVSVLDSLSGKNLQAIVLASDGIYNQGANPVLTSRNSPVPVYTVLIGDSSMPKDIAIRRLQTNQITYVNKELPVEVGIWQNGYDGQKAVISISEGNKVLAQRAVTLGKSGFEQKETLEIVAREAGDFNYTVSIQAKPGEITDRNNQQITRVQVLKSKIKVLVVSGAPNFDRRALSYLGDQLEDYTFSFLTEKGPGLYFERPFREAALDSQDLFIFYGFPTRNSDPVQIRELMKQVTRRQVPVLWFIARALDFQKLREFESVLPFESTSRVKPVENQFVRLTAGGRLYPVTRLDENETVNDLLWKELPPLEVYHPLKMRSGAQVLLEPDTRKDASTRSRMGSTVCYTYRQNEIKYLVFNGTNFSNWHYQLQDDPARDRFFIRFMERTVRWLVNRDDIHQIQIQPLQRIYNVGEQIVFSGQVYDEFYQPVSDARVVVTVGSDTTRFSDEMIAEGNGFYRQAFSGLPEGEFSYRIEARRNEKTIGTRSGKFTVNPFFLEFQQIPANAALMSQLANETGGRYYLPARFTRNFPESKLESRIQYTSAEYFLWNYWYWLAIMVLLLGTEWFLRKRWGLL